jgi:flotillin
MNAAAANASARPAMGDRDAEAKLTEAGARQRAEQARLTADKAVAVAENELRIRKAELARDAAAKEVEQQKAEVLVEQARLSATEVARAIAARDVAKAKAEGDAAKTFEEGKARALAIEQIGQSVQRYPEALKVMLLEMMPGFVQELAKTIENVDLGRVTVIDGGDGRAIAGAALGRAKTLSESLAMIESVLGVDLHQLSQSIATKITGAPAVAGAEAGTKTEVAAR